MSGQLEFVNGAGGCLSLGDMGHNFAPQRALNSSVRWIITISSDEVDRKNDPANDHHE
jgi:hypothetical protein